MLCHRTTTFGHDKEEPIIWDQAKLNLELGMPVLLYNQNRTYTIFIRSIPSVELRVKSWAARFIEHFAQDEPENPC